MVKALVKKGGFTPFLVWLRPATMQAMNKNIIVKNGGLLTGALVAQKILALGAFVVLARSLDPVALGLYAYVLTTVMFMGVFADMGITTLIVTRLAAGEAVVSARSHVTLKYVCLVVTVCVFALLAVTVFHLSGWSLLCAMVLLILDSLSLTLYGLLRSTQNMVYESVGMVVGQVLGLGAFAIIYTQGGGVEWFLLALCGVSLTNLVVSLVGVVRSGLLPCTIPIFDMAYFAHAIGSHIPRFGGAALLSRILASIDAFAIRGLLGLGALGLYSVPYRVAYVAQFVPIALSGALLPHISARRGYASSVHEGVPGILTAYALLVPVSMALSVGGALIGNTLAEILFGEVYTRTTLLLPGLALGAAVLFLYYPLAGFLTAHGRQGHLTLILAGTVCIDAVLLIALVPHVGVMGAVIAGLVSNVFLTVCVHVLAVRMLDRRFMTSLGLIYGRGCVAGAGMALCLVIGTMLSLNPFLVAFGASVGFVLVYTACRGFSFLHYAIS